MAECISSCMYVANPRANKSAKGTSLKILSHAPVFNIFLKKKDKKKASKKSHA